MPEKRLKSSADSTIRPSTVGIHCYGTAVRVIMETKSMMDPLPGNSKGSERLAVSPDEEKACEAYRIR